jgi:NTE family protein
MGELAGIRNRRNWLRSAGAWLRRPVALRRKPPRIGLALGGGFARGIAHLGVLRAFERHGVEIASIAGVSAGSMVAAAYASGSTLDEIEQIARGMRFRDVARWTISRLGLAETDRMVVFLKRLLKADRFESMRIPLAVVASDLSSGQPAVFRDSGDVVTAIRASCAYPGLYQPVRYDGRILVDGLVSMEVPALPLKQMGVSHVVSVVLPAAGATDPQSLFAVVHRCFQILSSRTEHEWRRHSSVVITPKVRDVAWDGFQSCANLIQAGEQAAEQAMPHILAWFDHDDGLRVGPPWTAPAVKPAI